jgi:DNA-directed RNA polymerase subunit L
MYVDTTNNTDNIISVTTKEAKFYLREKSIPSPYENDIQLIKLQPKQTIKMSCITELNIEEENSIYSPVTVCYFQKNSENDYDFILESRGQLNELEILSIMYDNIINQLDIFYDLIPDIKDMEGKISFNNAEHTLGNIVSEGLQNHNDVLFGGYNMPHPLDNKIVITYKLQKNNIKSVMKDVIDKYKKIFSDINSKLVKL